jgi:ATP-dependent Lhr-like helicase
MTTSSAFELLDERIQRWIWAQEWSELRDIQERAIREIMGGRHDVIITAATASGKTEAAFLPLLTRLVQGEGGLLVYISPLKALINDQFGRLTTLCEMLEVPVWPWHGDVSQSTKARFLKKPTGVLLITPEALEATLCLRGSALARIFGKLEAMVIDELHAFIGEERGKQLQSLLHRTEDAVGRRIQRVGLSATLGDMPLAARFMRPNGAADTVILQSGSDGNSLKLIIKGYLEESQDLPLLEVKGPKSNDAVVEDLYKVMRGSNNLLFPNTRALVERYASALRARCEADSVPNEFWPHHGSLSREIREDTEQALKSREMPATAVCTNTLELGIDIGPVKSVGQVGAPHAVASLRQRLGRSGRRKGQPAVLRVYCVEPELTTTSHLLDELREGFIQSCAMVSLLLEGWFEPPKVDALHFSTLIQQILSLISQKSGVLPARAYALLCKTGPFAGVSAADFAALLKQMGHYELLMQESDGTLLHAKRGEKLVNHYSFYAAFAEEAEFRIVTAGRTLGAMPISSPVSEGSFLLFGGKNWRVSQVDIKSKTLTVDPARTGKPPQFVSSGAVVHGVVRERMRAILADTSPLPYVDSVGVQLLAEARAAFSRVQLHTHDIVQQGARILVFTWMGDAANEALVLALRHAGVACQVEGPIIEVQAGCRNVTVLRQTLAAIGNSAPIDPQKLLEGADNLVKEKWDWALPPQLLKRAYASLWLDIPAAQAWAKAAGQRKTD